MEKVSPTTQTGGVGTAAPTAAAKLRLQGNDAFKRAKLAGLAPVLVASRLSEAIGAYRAALRATSIDDVGEAASSARNLGVAISLSSKYGSLDDHGGALGFVKLVAEGFHAFVVASDKGQLARKPEEWLTAVEDAALALVETAMQFLSKSAVDIHANTRFNEMLADALCDIGSHGRAWLSKALIDAYARGSVIFAAPAAASAQIVAIQMLLNSVVTLVDAAGVSRKQTGTPADGEEGKDESDLPSVEEVRNCELSAIRSGLPLLSKCDPHLERARSFLGPTNARKEHPKCKPGAVELAELVESIALHRAILESRQARLRGDQLLASATKCTEELSVEGAWAAVDAYKEAILLAREIDVEGEAIAYSALGKVYSRVLKLKDRGLQAYHRSIELAMSCSPRPFTTHQWYRDALAEVEDAQRRARQAQEAAEAAQEAELLKDEQDALDAINKAAAESGLALLRHIYAKHPPKKADAVLGPVDAENIKSTLKKAIAHYHPDKQGKEHGPKWAALANYICKRLTAAYEVHK